MLEELQYYLEKHWIIRKNRKLVVDSDGNYIILDLTINDKNSP